jgi:DNA-binding MarR family transcriptional regulator
MFLTRECEQEGGETPKLSMTANSQSQNLVLKLWFLLHQVRDVIMSCEDQVFGKQKLTTERYLVLALTKLSDGHARPADLARWLGRSPNSVSMLVDRMVKAGLIKRVRNRGDRRAVRLIMTSKGETALRPATVAGLDFIQKVLSPLSYEDKHTFARLLETTKHQAFQCLNHRVDIEDVEGNDITNYPDLMNRLVQYVSTSTPKGKGRAGRKAKIIR